MLEKNTRRAGWGCSLLLMVVVLFAIMGVARLAEYPFHHWPIWYQLPTFLLSGFVAHGIIYVVFRVIDG